MCGHLAACVGTLTQPLFASPDLSDGGLGKPFGVSFAADASRRQNHKRSFGYKSLFQSYHHSEKESAKTPPPTAEKKLGAYACFCSRHLPTLRSSKISTLCCCHSSGGQGYWCRRTDPRDKPDTPRVVSGGGFSLQNVGKLS